MFVDIAKIKIKAGDGGAGAVAFHREKYVAAGGPDGGDGGKGGDVVFVVDDNLATLADFRYKRKYVAKNGENGRGSRQYGKKAPDLEIKVPRGTIIREANSGAVMTDLLPQKAVKAAGATFISLPLHVKFRDLQSPVFRVRNGKFHLN